MNCTIWQRTTLVACTAMILATTLISPPPAAAEASTPAATPPNVILVLTDDQGYGDLSCHGNPVLKTPNLDRLYAESIRLTDFHVVPMCTPTRGQLMSGVDCLRNGAMNVSSGRTLLRRQLPTMADLFAESGIEVIFGAPVKDAEELVHSYLADKLETGGNICDH